MIASRNQVWIALLAGSVAVACVANSGAQVERARGSAVSPSFVLQNMSQEKIAVYLVEGAQETLLRRIAPLQVERVPLPDRVFTSRSATVTLAIVRSPASTLRPSLEDGAVVSVPLRSASLIGQLWSFSSNRLYRPYR